MATGILFSAPYYITLLSDFKDFWGFSEISSRMLDPDGIDHPYETFLEALIGFLFVS